MTVLKTKDQKVKVHRVGIEFLTINVNDRQERPQFVYDMKGDEYGWRAHIHQSCTMWGYIDIIWTTTTTPLSTNGTFYLLI